MGGRFFPDIEDDSQTKMMYSPGAPKIKKSTGSKKWDPSTEPDLRIEYCFSISVKLPVLLLKIEWHFDEKLWLLQGVSAAPQGLEDGGNGEKLAKMSVLQMGHSHIREVPPRVSLDSRAPRDVGRSISCLLRTQ